MIPQNSTRCWYFLGILNEAKMIAITKMLSMLRESSNEFIVVEPKDNSGKRKGNRDPNESPFAGFFGGDYVCCFMKYTQIYGEECQNNCQEEDPYCHIVVLYKDSD